MRASRNGSAEVMTSRASEVPSGHPLEHHERPQLQAPAPHCPDDRLVGRQAELAWLGAALAGPRAQGPRAVEVVGEPGIGKTRLLTEFSVRAERAGQLVLAGRAAEFERETPFGVLVEAMDDHLASIDPRRLERIGADLREPLAAVFPSLAWHATGAEVERYRVHRAVRALLEEITPLGGLVLVLDDLHWADEASVELVVHLLRNPVPAPMLLVLAYRPRQVPARLSAALAGDRLTKRLEVGPLSAQEADELLGEGMSRRQRRALYRDSGGNPFYLRALARARGGASAPIPPCGDANAPVPAAVQAALLGEFHALSETGQLVAHAAAVAGDAFELELLAAVAGLGEDETLAALDELLAADLIRPAASPGRFRYRHHLVRSVAYETAGAGWRLAAHARAATTLAAANAPAVARAHHVARAARVGDEAAIAVLVEAARATRSRAPATAAHWLRAALRLLPNAGGWGESPQAGGWGESPNARGWGESPNARGWGESPNARGWGESPNTESGGEVARRAELLFELAVALLSAGRVHASRDTLHEILPLLPPGSSDRRALAVTFCAVTERMLGRHAESRALLLAELAALPGPETDASIGLKLVLATSARSGSREELDANRAWGEEALAAARRCQDPLLVASALAAVAYASLTAGDIHRALTCVREASPRVDALPDGVLASHLYSLSWLGWSELHLERYDDAIRHLERGLVIARHAGRTSIAHALCTPLGLAYRRLGRLDDAARALDDAVDAALLTDSEALRRIPLGLQSYVAAVAEDYQLAERAGQQALEVAGQVNDRGASVARSMIAWARLAASGAGGCVEEIIDAWGGPQLPAWDAPDRPEAYEALVRAELARGCAGAADQWAERAEAAAAALELNTPTGFALLARSYTLLSHDPAGSAEHALAAAAAFQKVGSRLEAGRAHLLAGTALAVVGERSSALDELSQAEALLDACGARSLRDQARREQRQLGRSGARGGHEPNGVLALSARELEIAELVAEGHTNRQIARTLSLSDKTVETHLSRTFSKLGVDSRAAVATAVTKANGSRGARVASGPGGPRTVEARALAHSAQVASGQQSGISPTTEARKECRSCS